MSKVTAPSMGSGGRIEMCNTKDMWDIMKSQKGNRKVDIAATPGGAMGGSYWFERNWKRRFTGVAKNATKA